ncbi:MAG: zinc-binding dehydrogenase, partial [Balneolaceae bacterium]|nr:zinc-binding dehydrogenase [Balneolaceae bacterium]
NTLKDARIFTTAGSEEKLELCRSLGAELAINYHDQSYADRITEKAGKDSVHVIIDFIGAPYWKDNIHVAALDARIILLSMLGGAVVDQVSLVPILKKRLTILGSTLRNRSQEYKIELMDRFWSDTSGLFQNKEIQPVIDSIYDWKDAEKAHKRMANNQNAGKIILTGM